MPYYDTITGEEIPEILTYTDGNRTHEVNGTINIPQFTYAIDADRINAINTAWSADTVRIDKEMYCFTEKQAERIFKDLKELIRHYTMVDIPEEEFMKILKDDD